MEKKITTLFIDLDGTVYDRKNGLLDELTKRILKYMNQEIHIPLEESRELIDRYYQTYGSSLRGIQEEFSIDPHEYLDYVHDIDLDRFLQPDEALRDILAAIPIPKWIFTNSPLPHASRVLEKLGLEDQFEGIIDILCMDYLPKPNPWVYQHALELAGSPNPQQCAMIEDTARNLIPAQQIGFSTIWIGEQCLPHGVQLSIPRLHELPVALEMLTNGFVIPSSFLYPADLQSAYAQ